MASGFAETIQRLAKANEGMRDMTVRAIAILMYLDDCFAEPINRAVTRVMAEFGIGHSSMVRVVKRLELEGMIRRDTIVEDGRYVVLTLTTVGQTRATWLRGGAEGKLPISPLAPAHLWRRGV